MAKKTQKKSKVTEISKAPKRSNLGKNLALVALGAVLGALLGGLVLHKYEMHYMHDRMVEQSGSCH